MMMSAKSYKYLFGPVPSRRLGRSLGIDLVPFKVCSFDCIYCQLGRTTNKTVERKEWVPTEDVIAEIRDWFQSGNEADAITLAGSGEPTLHSGFGQVLDAIKKISPVRRILLSNGSLFHIPEVRQGAAHADVVKVTLSASSAAGWNRLHRQSPDLRFLDMVDGLRLFRKDFAGELWIEVMILENVNSLDSEIREIAEIVGKLQPNRIQLNTAVRPSAEITARPIVQEEMERLARLFKPEAEVIGKYQARQTEAKGELSEADILSMLRRHPCSVDEIAGTFGASTEATGKLMEQMEQTGQVKVAEISGVVCYMIPPNEAIGRD